jgi:hypothetical protein
MPEAQENTETIDLKNITEFWSQLNEHKEQVGPLITKKLRSIRDDLFLKEAGKNLWPTNNLSRSQPFWTFIIGNLDELFTLYKTASMREYLGKAFNIKPSDPIIQSIAYNICDMMILEVNGPLCENQEFINLYQEAFARIQWHDDPESYDPELCMATSEIFHELVSTQLKLNTPRQIYPANNRKDEAAA